MFDNYRYPDDEDDLDDRDVLEDRHYLDDVDDGDTGHESFVRLAADIEAGRADMPPGWSFGRPSPEVLVWTTPSGRRYAYDLNGQPLPLP